MKNLTYLKTLLLATLCAVPAIAFAQAAPGLYVSGDLGAGSFNGSVRSINSHTKFDVDLGVSETAAVGWQFGNGFRAEMQEAYQSNGLNDIVTRRSGVLEPLGGVSGRVAAYSAMANVLYDLPVRHLLGALQPYLGVGAGYGWFDTNSASGSGFGTFHLPENNVYQGADTVRFGSAGAFAYQGIAGVSLPIRSVPGLKLDAEYRYFGTARANVPVSRFGASGALINGVVPSLFSHNGVVAADNMLMIGLRYSLEAAN